MSNDFTPTKAQIQTTNVIKIDPDNFSWSLIDFNESTSSDGKRYLQFKCIKTAKLKKLNEINEIDKEDGDIKPLGLSSEMLKSFTIELGSMKPENQIFFHDNVKNISNAFTKLINIIKND